MGESGRRCRMGPPQALLLALALLAGAPARADPGFADWPKEDKALALSLGVGAATLGWGIWNWEWGETGPRFQDEGWFGRGTTEGGADKLGHLWIGYALSHLLAGQYTRWDYPPDEAARLGALTSAGTMTLVEVGDAFSDKFGFSYQDFLFNLAGAGLGYVLWTNPDLAARIDLRAEYDPFTGDPFQLDVFTDYDRLRYLVALKAEGFEGITNPLLRSLELHVGFYARNYDDFSPDTPDIDPRERHVYVGIGLNVTRLLGPVWDTGLFDYIQLPYTYLPFDRRVD